MQTQLLNFDEEICPRVNGLSRGNIKFHTLEIIEKSFRVFRPIFCTYLKTGLEITIEPVGLLVTVGTAFDVTD